MSDPNKADITGVYPGQEPYQDTIGPIEIGMLADCHTALARLHKDDAGLFADHSERAARLRELNVDLAWFARQPSPRPPPIDDRLEQALLGELLRRTAYRPLPSALSEHDFGDPVHANIYAAMQRCHAKRTLYNLDNVGADLRDKPDLEEVGGTAYLMQIAKMALLPNIGAGEAAQIISETAHARWLLGSLDEITRLVRSQEEIIPIDLDSGAGRMRAHLVALEMIGIAHRMLDQSAGWA